MILYIYIKKKEKKKKKKENNKNNTSQQYWFVPWGRIYPMFLIIYQK